jgi:hydrogenase maturation protease
VIEISIIGIGNILYGDDGVGVHLINYLRERKTIPNDISLIDGDIDTFSIANYLIDSNYSIIIDACDFKDKKAGSLKKIYVDNSYLKDDDRKVSLHSGSVIDAIKIAYSVRKKLNITIYAIQVEKVYPNIGLSDILNTNFNYYENELINDSIELRRKYEQENPSC